jgi:hypothetical protein
MPDVVNPVQVEQRILWLANAIAEGVDVCNRHYKAYLDADRAYDAAKARAYLDADGSIKAKECEAELATTDLRAVLDVADAAYRYADRRAKALESELRAWQSVGASVRAMYGVAGRGEHT